MTDALTGDGAPRDDGQSVCGRHARAGVILGRLHYCCLAPNHDGDHVCWCGYEGFAHPSANEIEARS